MRKIMILIIWIMKVIQKIYLISILLMITMEVRINLSVMIQLLMMKKKEIEMEMMKMMMVKRKRTKEEQRIKRKVNRIQSHRKEHLFLRKIKEISNKPSKRNNFQGRNKENQWNQENQVNKKKTENESRKRLNSWEKMIWTLFCCGCETIDSLAKIRNLVIYFLLRVHSYVSMYVFRCTNYNYSNENSLIKYFKLINLLSFNFFVFPLLNPSLIVVDCCCCVCLCISWSRVPV